MIPPVKKHSRALLRVTLAGVLLLLLLGLVAPFINASSYSGVIRNALEASLGRKVEFEAIHLTLFSGPGFSLENVSIHEDPRYGLEPFAYVTTLKAHLRLDKLLLGKLQLSSLRLIEPSLTLVKRNDGTWNAVELVNRLTAPRSAPLSFLPAVEIADARIDFKLGVRKTTFYLANTDIALYPERSGKVFVSFSGSPARTDRAGIGFGHLRGDASWYGSSNGDANQLQADVTLDPSNLSELTTLFQGYDLGVHGAVASQVHIEGRMNALHVSGELRLEDVHRWDLLPAQGEDWRIRYTGNLNLTDHRLDLETVPWHKQDQTPVKVRVKANSFLTQPAWSVMALLTKAPAQNLLPLSSRMGMTLPEGLQLTGTLDGVVSYSARDGLAGGIAVTDAVATLPNAQVLKTPVARANISSERIHVDPAHIDTDFAGTLLAGGDYYPDSQRLSANLIAKDVPLASLKQAAAAWFGDPAALSIFEDGQVSGLLSYQHQGTETGSWSGQLQLAKAVIKPKGVAASLEDCSGRLTFDDRTLDLGRFSGRLGDQLIRGEYHYNVAARHTERIHLELSSADLVQFQEIFDPTLRAPGLLARLRLGKRSVPPWLSARNLEGDVVVTQIFANATPLGALRAHLLWQGTNIQFSSVRLQLEGSTVDGHGLVDVSAYTPRYRFSAGIKGYPWKGGHLNAQGVFQTFGANDDALVNLKASGTFAGQSLTLAPEEQIDRMAGAFLFSFDSGWPNLRLSNIQAFEGEDEWQGHAASQSDGKLVFDFEQGARQRHVVSNLDPTPSSTTLTSRAN